MLASTAYLTALIALFRLQGSCENYSEQVTNALIIQVRDASGCSSVQKSGELYIFKDCLAIGTPLAHALSHQNFRAQQFFKIKPVKDATEGNISLLQLTVVNPADIWLFVSLRTSFINKGARLISLKVQLVLSEFLKGAWVTEIDKLIPLAEEIDINENLNEKTFIGLKLPEQEKRGTSDKALLKVSSVSDVPLKLQVLQVDPFKSPDKESDLLSSSIEYEAVTREGDPSDSVEASYTADGSKEYGHYSPTSQKSHNNLAAIRRIHM